MFHLGVEETRKSLVLVFRINPRWISGRIEIRDLLDFDLRLFLLACSVQFALASMGHLAHRMRHEFVDLLVFATRDQVVQLAPFDLEIVVTLSMAVCCSTQRRNVVLADPVSDLLEQLFYLRALRREFVY